MQANAYRYYTLVMDHYLGGWGDKFHFCEFQVGESFQAALARCEHYIAHMADIKAGMWVLDLGSGMGGPAREIAVFTGATVVGITVSKVLVERSTAINKKLGLDVEIVEGDYMVCPPHRSISLTL